MSIQLIKKLSTKAALNDVEANTTRTGQKRRLIKNTKLVDQIKIAEPNLSLKSNSPTMAVKAWACFVFAQKPAPSTARKLLRLLHKLVPTLTGQDDHGYHSTVAIYTDIRNVISNTYGVKNNITLDSMTLMRANQRTYKRLMKAYNSKVDDKNRGGQDVFEDQVIYDAIDAAANSDDWRKLATGIELASGARIGEVLSIATFKKAAKDGYIIQTGITKQDKQVKFKRGMTDAEYLRLVKEKDDAKVESIEKPVLHVSVDQFIAMVAELRHQLKDAIEKIRRGEMTGYQFSQAKNSQINSVVKKMVPGATSHTLRKIYSDLSYKLHGADSGMSHAGWLSHVLGHQRGSVRVAASYSVVGVKTKVISPFDKKVVEAKLSELKSSDNSTDAQLAKLTRMVEQLNIELNNRSKSAPVQIGETLVNVPRNVRLRDGRAAERMAVSITALKKKGVPVTAKVLRELGYGSSTISAYRKTQKSNPVREEGKYAHLEDDDVDVDLTEEPKRAAPKPKQSKPKKKVGAQPKVLRRSARLAKK